MGDAYIKAHCEGMVNSSLCKNASVVLSSYVMKDNFIICINNELTITKEEKGNKWLMGPIFLDICQTPYSGDN